MERRKIPVTCCICGNIFTTRHRGELTARTCGYACRGVWQGKQVTGIRRSPHSEFKKGIQPWNAGLKGFHPSPATSFKQGQKAYNKLSVGSVRIRSFTRDGKQVAFVKIAEPNVWRERAKIVWESANGPIPKGMIIHHEDRNKLNDVLYNLSLETRSSHMKKHHVELDLSRRVALSMKYAKQND